MKLIGLDYLGISDNFSDEELMVQNTAREFCDNEIIPIIEDCFKEARFPKELIPKFAELGFFGVPYANSA